MGWNVQFDRGFLSRSVSRCAFRELLLEKVRAVGGQLVVSASNGKIQSAELDAAGEYYLLRFETDCGVVAGDLIRCAVFNGPTPKAYWVEVAAVDNGWRLLPFRSSAAWNRRPAMRWY